MGAKAFYSDPIDDIYWTLVEQFTIDSKREIEKLVKEVEPFFKKHKKHFSFYLTPYDRRRNVDKYLKELGYKITAKDNFMFLEKGHLKRRDLSLQSGVTLKEIKTDKDNEIYIDCYTRAYTSNPEDTYFNFGTEGVYEGIYRKTWKGHSLRKKMRKFVGFYKGKPASCGAIYFGNKLGYIAEVGTDNEFRRKGLARAVSLVCINAGIDEGCSVILLGTEKDTPAEKLYQSLGFVSKTVFWGMSRV